MEAMEIELKKVIEEKEKTCAEVIKDLSRISDDYNRMVNSGLTAQRSYNLMTISDVQKVKYEVNS